MRAVFVMIDNTLVNTISKRKVPLYEDDWKFNLELLEFLRELSKKRYYICLVLNNSLSFDGNKLNPISTKRKLDNILKTMEKKYKFNSDLLGCISYAEHSDVFRLVPNPGSLYDIASDKEIFLKQSFLIGSCEEEVELTNNAGIGTFLDINDPYYLSIN